MTGLCRGTVKLYDHETEWEKSAADTVANLRTLFGNTASDIEHIGSTSIKMIKAKPIIDIAVVVESFDSVKPLIPALQNAGFYYRRDSAPEMQMLFACGSYYEGSGDVQTHFIHVVIRDSIQWRDYINFRDYLNAYPDKAKEYEALKISLSERFAHDRNSYINGKSEFIRHTLRKALAWSFLGKNVTVIIDRPVGYCHQKNGYSLIYPVNYGYIPGVTGGDGEELDVYVLGVESPLEKFSGRIIGIINRENDTEDKLVAAREDVSMTADEIYDAVRFQEQFFTTKIELYDYM